MNATESNYKKLPGSGARNLGFVSAFRLHARLYQATDHLLMVESNGYTEDYRRFYYKDIHAIIVRMTNKRMVWNIVLGIIALLGTAFASVVDDTGIRVFWEIFTCFFLLCLLINTLKGGCCICHMKTAVQTEELPSLNRVPRAQKVIARIRPLIEAAQGALAPGEAQEKTRELFASSAIPAIPTPPVLPPETIVPPAQ